jgi:glutamyl-tRNA synthetase
MKLDKPIAGFSFEGIHRGNAVVNFRDEDPIDPKALWLNSQHLRALPIEILLHLVKVELEQAGLKPPYDDAWLKDFAIRGRAYFADDFTIEPDALARLDMPGTREALRKLADKLAANPEFTDAGVEADLRALAGELSVKAGLLINGARAALTGQPVGPGAFRLFVAIGRDRAITRLRAV